MKNDIISQGTFYNGAYESVGLAIENSDLAAFTTALTAVGDTNDIYGKGNLNETKANLDSEKRHIFEVAIIVFESLKPYTTEKENALKIIELMINSDKIDKSNPVVLDALYRQWANLDDPKYKNRFKVLLDTVCRTSEVHGVIYKSNMLPKIISHLKTLYAPARLQKIIETNVLKLIETKKDKDLVIKEIAEGGFLTKDLVTPTLAREIFKNGKNLHLYPELYGILLESGNLKLSPQELKDQLNLAIRADAGRPEAAIHLVAYYTHNEALLKDLIGKNLVDAETLRLVAEKSNDKEWKKLYNLLLVTGKVEVVEQQVISEGYLWNSTTTSIDPLLNNLTPELLEVLIGNGNLAVKDLSNENRIKFARVIAESKFPDFVQYVEMLREVDPELVSEIAKNSPDDNDKFEYLVSNNLLKNIPNDQSGITLLKEGRLAYVERLVRMGKVDLKETEKKSVDTKDSFEVVNGEVRPVTLTVETGNNLLHFAIANGQLRLAAEIIFSANHLDICSRNKQGFTPLLLLLNQPYSEEKSKLMANIMLHKEFKYNKEKVYKKISHIVNSINDYGTAKRFLELLKTQTTNGKRGTSAERFQWRVQNLFAQALINNNTVLAKAILDNYADLVDLNRLKYKAGKKEDGSLIIEELSPAYVAYTYGNMEIIDLLLENKKFNVNQIFSKNDRLAYGIPLLHYAAIDGKIGLVSDILKSDKVYPNIITSDGRTPVLDAIYKLNELFLKTPKDETIQTQIVGLKEVISLLGADSKVDLSIADNNGDTPHLALYRQIMFIDKKLKDLKETHAQNRVLGTIKNALSGEIEYLESHRLFLKTELEKMIGRAPAALNRSNKQGENIFIQAVLNGDIKTVKIVLEHTSNIESLHSQRDSNGNTPLMFAYASGNKEVVDAIRALTNDEAFKSKNNDNQGLLVAAIKGGSRGLTAEVVNKLGRQSIAERDILGNNAIHHATKNVVILKNLLEENNSSKVIDAKNNEGLTPLCKAILSGDGIETIEALLNANADVNIADNLGNTPLMYACMLNRVDVIEALLAKADLDVRAVNKIGATAYMYAAVGGTFAKASEGDAKAQEQLDTTLAATKNEKIDQNARWSGNPVVLKALLSHGADPFFGNYSSTFTQSLLNSTLSVLGYSVATSMTSRVFGSDNIIHQTLKASMAFKMAHSVYTDTKKATERSVERLYYSEETAENIDLTNQCMIGTLSIGRLGGVYTGRDLMDALDGTGNFKNGTSNLAIYDTAELESKIARLSKEQKETFHETLQARYCRIQTAMDSSFMPFWTRASLLLLQREILAADKIVAGDEFFGKDANAVEKKLEDTFKMLGGKGRDRFILEMLEQPITSIKFNKFSALISKIRSNKVYVPANLMYTVIEFDKRFKELKEQKENPSLYRRIVNSFFWKKPNPAKSNIILDQVNNFKPYIKTGKAGINRNKDKNSANKVPDTYLAQSINLLARATGTNPNDIVKSVASACGAAKGITYGAATFALLDVEHTLLGLMTIDRLWAPATYLLSTTASTAASAAMSVIGATIAAVTSPVGLAAGFGVAAVMGIRAYMSSSPKPKEEPEEKPFVPEKVYDVVDPKCTPDAAKKLLHDGCKEIEIASLKTARSTLDTLSKSTNKEAVKSLPKLTKQEYIAKQLATTSIQTSTSPTDTRVEAKVKEKTALPTQPHRGS